MSTKLSDEEVEWLDSARGALSRAEFLRWLVTRERKRRTALDGALSAGAIHVEGAGFPTHEESPAPVQADEIAAKVRKTP